MKIRPWQVVYLQLFAHFCYIVCSRCTISIFTFQNKVVYLQWRVAMCDLHIFQKTDWGKLRFKRWNKKFIIAVQSWSNVVVFVTGSFLDVTVTGHWHHDFQFLQLTVLQFLKRKNRFRILETRGLVPVSWTTPIHTKRYSLTVDSFQKRFFCVTDNR